MLLLTSKWFSPYCLPVPIAATFPRKINRYLDDNRRVTFLKLLKSWFADKYRTCYICRTYHPINGGQVQDLIEERTQDELRMDVRLRPPVTKKVVRTTLWKDEDWMFVSLGKRVNKSGMMETRTYCPACVREVDVVRIGRRRIGRTKWRSEEAKMMMVWIGV